MIPANFTSIREIQRNYKKISDEVNKTDIPTIVMSNNKPQFAVVSLKMLYKIHEQKQNKSLQGLIEIAEWAGKHNLKAPKDLSEKHNEYAWD